MASRNDRRFGLVAGAARGAASIPARAAAHVARDRLEDVADAMSLYGFPSAKEQASPTWLGGGANGAAAKALTQQANFLKEQGRLTTVVPDYSKNVTTEWVTKAM